MLPDDENTTLTVLHRMLFERKHYTVTFDGAEHQRLERYFREEATPNWQHANEVMEGDDPDPLTMEEALHALVTDALERAEREAGLVGMLDGSVWPIAAHAGHRYWRDGKRRPLRMVWRQWRCKHEAVLRSHHGKVHTCKSCGHVEDQR